jgi:hypothetical protein
MRTNSGIITRRDFLRGATAGVIATAIGSQKADAGLVNSDRATVVLIRDENAVDHNGKPNAGVILSMLDQGINALLGTEKPHLAWRKLVAGVDSIGIKTNFWPSLRTPPELEHAVSTRLVEAGISERNIPIDDWGARESLASCPALINMRPLRTHHWAGIGGCLKNYIMFVKEPSAYHGNACADLGKIWNLPTVKGKTRLNILVVLTPQFHGRGAHHFSQKYVWNYRGLIISQDPVAADSVGVRLLVEKRREFFQREEPFETRTHHVQYADARHGIGVADPKRIDLVKIGWEEGVLI